MTDIVKVTLLVKDDLLADEVRRRAEEAFRNAFAVVPLDTPSGEPGFTLAEVELFADDRDVIVQSDAWLTAHGFTPDVQATEFSHAAL